MIRHIHIEWTQCLRTECDKNISRIPVLVGHCDVKIMDITILTLNREENLPQNISLDFIYWLRGNSFDVLNSDNFPVFFLLNSNTANFEKLCQPRGKWSAA